ncbi:MAG: hypothetical protein Q7J07_09530 [Pelolinea sp.]|nr:hypothetical protein [Pelolinea sp.]
MSVIVEIQRYFPPNFFDSANKKNGFVSRSEQLSKAVLCVTLGINGEEIRKGDPNNKEPDWVTRDNDGIEVTFASEREPSSVLQAKTGVFNADDLEQEIIASISDSIKEKSDKKQKGNYLGISNVTVFIICLYPLLNWYGHLYGFNYPRYLGNRNKFFNSLYEKYIKSSEFKNIYILCN